MDQRPIFQVTSKAGIQRDGTTLDSPNFVNGQWVRFYRGRARKMGGYKSVVEDLQHIPRGVFTFTKNNVNSIYLFNSNGSLMIQTDDNLTGTLPFNVSPTTSFAPNDLYKWQAAGIYDATGGGDNLVLAHAALNLTDISSSTNLPIFYHSAGDSTATFATVSDGAGGTVSVSGGVCVLQPFVFAYGNDGLIKNSNANKPNDWTVDVGNEANEVNVAYTKIVKGLPIRGGGQSPAGLFWALDSLVKVTYNDGPSIFNYDPMGFSTVMSSDGIIEFNGIFYWMGLDKFYAYTGKIDELPNQMNINWVFDNLNFEQRQKVWATAIPRWGEIWWFFPFGQGQTECNRAAIFNVRENTWYDCEIARSCGVQVQTLRYPIWAGNTQESAEDVAASVTMTIASPCVVTWTNHDRSIGDEIVFSTTGALPSGITAGVTYYVADTPTASTLKLSTTVGGAYLTTSGSQSGVHTATTPDVPRYIAYGHETGYNKVQAGQEVAIQSYVETSDFGFPTGGATGEQPSGQDYFTRLIRVEPDFVQTGDMTLSVIGNEFAQDGAPKTTSYTFGATATKVDMREQRRMIRLKFESNEVDGFYEMGRVILHTEPGDIRS